LVGLAPKTYRYVSKRPDDSWLRQRLKELASQRRRFGYRRLHLMLRREGIMLNWKKLYRLYREERLMVRKRGGRKRALGTRAPMATPQCANQRWSIDFVSDALACSRRFRILAVVDEFSRECLALITDNSISGIRVARELDRIVEMRGRPCMIVSDNGTELTSRAMLEWQQEHRVEKDGGSTTTPSDHTRALTASHQRSLQLAPHRGITRTDSPYERGQIGEHVKIAIAVPAVKLVIAVSTCFVPT
jgi:putative transposase